MKTAKLGPYEDPQEVARRKELEQRLFSLKKQYKVPKPVGSRTWEYQLPELIRFDQIETKSEKEEFLVGTYMDNPPHLLFVSNLDTSGGSLGPLYPEFPAMPVLRRGYDPP